MSRTCRVLCDFRLRKYWAALGVRAGIGVLPAFTFKIVQNGHLNYSCEYREMKPENQPSPRQRWYAIIAILRSSNFFITSSGILFIIGFFGRATCLFAHSHSSRGVKISPRSKSPFPCQMTMHSLPGATRTDVSAEPPRGIMGARGSS